MSTSLEGAAGISSDSRSREKSRVRGLLARSVPVVFNRKLQSPEFVNEHRLATRAVLEGTPRMSPGSAAGQLPVVGESWNLPDLLTPDQERSLFVVLNAARFEASSVRDRMNSKRPSRKAIERLEGLLAEADMVREHLCAANVRLVISIAGRMADNVVGFEDLFGEGLMILLKAIDGFDFSKGFRFSTYATNSLQRHFFRLRKRTLRKRQFGAPIADEILGTASDGSDGVGLPPDDPLKLTRKILRAANRVLDKRERRILELRFGLRGSEHTLREIAAVLQVSKERVRQVLARAVSKLQDVATGLRLEWTPRELASPARLGA